MPLTPLTANSFANTPVFVLCNPRGIRAELCALGASILRVHTPDRAGTLKNIALSYEDVAAWRQSGSYAGATIGPVAGRLRGGLLSLPDRVCSLARNDGENTLHGGFHGLSQALWQVDAHGDDFVSFSCRLPDGLDGFPGNRDFCAHYTLDANDCLTVEYTARTDRPTYVNLTNHIYWNLTGDFSADAYSQQLEIMADEVVYNDAAHLPLETRAVHGTAFDFTAPCTLRRAMEADMQNPQLLNAKGYNNAYLLRPGAKFAAQLSDPASGRRVTLRTGAPALVLYSGGYLSVPGCAIALEAQNPPASCEPVLLPGQTWRHTISFTFETLT